MTMDILLTFDNLGEAYDLLRFGHAAGGTADGLYANRHGTPRILELLAQRELPATFFIEGWSAAKYPAFVREIVAAGHEVAAHGWLHEEWDQLDADTERELVRRTTETLADVLGASPAGWRAPWAKMTTRTLGLLADYGYRYDASFTDADGPYRIDVAPGDDRSLVELPFFQTINDTLYYAFPGTVRSPQETTGMWFDELAALAGASGYGVVTAHPRHSGRPARGQALGALLDQLLAGEVGPVRFLRCADAAAEYGRRPDLPHYPAPSALEKGQV